MLVEIIETFKKLSDGSILHPGDVIDLPNEKAERLIEKGRAQPLPRCGTCQRSPRIQKITRATNPDKLAWAMADYIPGQLTDSELIELTKAYELKMAEFMPENQPILDPGGAIRAFNACQTTKELWEATCRIDPGDWPSEVFERVWDCYTAVEGRLVEQGEPRVFHYFPENQVGGHHDDICPVDTLNQTGEPERPLPALPRYRAGDCVNYLHKTALNVQIGTIAEIKTYPTSTWYRIRDGDALRWVGEAHIQGLVVKREGGLTDAIGT